MADTLPDFKVAPKQWINLYDAVGIPVGTAVTVYNKGTGYSLLAISANEPADRTMGFPLCVIPATMAFAVISQGESGLWIYSESGTCVLVQVQ